MLINLPLLRRSLTKPSKQHKNHQHYSPSDDVLNDFVVHGDKSNTKLVCLKKFTTSKRQTSI